MKIKLNKGLILESLKETAMNIAKNGGTIGTDLYQHAKVNQGLDSDVNKTTAEKSQFDKVINHRDSDERAQEKARQMEMKAKGF